MWPLAELTGDCIKGFFLKANVLNVWPCCQAEKSDRNNEVTVLRRWPQGGVPL